MFEIWWKRIKTTILIFGVLLSFLVIIELLHAYVVLRDIHFLLGYVFISAISLGFLCLLGYFVLEMLKFPPVLIPPPAINLNEASIEDLESYKKYLVKYIRRFGENENLDQVSRGEAKAISLELKNATEYNNSKVSLARVLTDIETDFLKVYVKDLDDLARKEITNTVRQVMLGVTLSPYKGADLLFALYKNGAMILRIIRIYNSRPHFQEQVQIFRDVMRVVSAINFINMSEKLIEGLFAKIPFIGRYVDDLGQGVGAGLLTRSVGHTAMERCRALHSWNMEKEVHSLTHQFNGYTGEVRDIFKESVLPKMKNRISSVAPNTIWEKLNDGFSSAVDETGKAVDSFVKRPSSQVAGKIVGGVGWAGEKISSVKIKIASSSKITADFIKRFFRKRNKNR